MKGIFRFHIAEAFEHEGSHELTPRYFCISCEKDINKVGCYTIGISTHTYRNLGDIDLFVT